MVQLELAKRLQAFEIEFRRVQIEDIRALQLEFKQSQMRQIEALEAELRKLKSDHVQLQNRAFQPPTRQPRADDQQKVEQSAASSTSSSRQPIELETKRSNRFNKTQFVLDCLKENSDMPSAEIKERAEKLQQSISDPIISMARSDFKNQQKLKSGEIEVEIN